MISFPWLSVASPLLHMCDYAVIVQAYLLPHNDFQPPCHTSGPRPFGLSVYVFQGFSSLTFSTLLYHSSHQQTHINILSSFHSYTLPFMIIPFQFTTSPTPRLLQPPFSRINGWLPNHPIPSPHQILLGKQNNRNLKCRTRLCYQLVLSTRIPPIAF